MPTNLAIDEALLEEALRLGGHRSKRATVNEALAEHIARRKRVKLLDLFGKVELDPGYDYKRARKRRRSSSKFPSSRSLSGAGHAPARKFPRRSASGP